MKRILVLFFTLLAVFSARGQKTVGQLYYLGAEADADGAIAACMVGGAYFSGVNVELRFCFPIGTKETAYYNLPGRYGHSREMELQSGLGLEAFAGYSILSAGSFRLTPLAGMRYTPISGKATDMSLREQRSYVFSGLVALKAEYILSPSFSLVATPGYAVPFGRDAFVRSFEASCPAFKRWYSGLFIHAGVHINF